jgi:hypothetical protein
MPSDVGVYSWAFLNTLIPGIDPDGVDLSDDTSGQVAFFRARPEAQSRALIGQVHVISQATRVRHQNRIILLFR